MSDTRDHWDSIFAHKADEEMSWFQGVPATSLELLSQWCTPEASLIDIGAGSARLVDELVERGWRDVTLLDISHEALDIVRQRLSGRATSISYVTNDIREWSPTRRYQSWHDRAVFHFLVSDLDQRHYVNTAARALEHGAPLIIATFSSSGPTHCSGLPIAQHDPEQIAELFAPEFDFVASRIEEHTTPFKSVQSFAWSVLRRR
ncbi:MAG: class I SAM-dependent methyltransferase [Acidimicrobiales bacterium]